MQNYYKTIYYPADWIAGVDYDVVNKNEDENYDPKDDSNGNNDQYNEDAEYDDEEAYDCIDQNELNELLAKPREEKDANPINKENENDSSQFDQ